MNNSIPTSGKGAGSAAATQPTNAKALTITKTETPTEPKVSGLHEQLTKFQKLQDLVKSRDVLSRGKTKLNEIISKSSDKNPIQVTFSEQEYLADEFTFGNENLIRATADFLIKQFDTKLVEVEDAILKMTIV